MWANWSCECQCWAILDVEVISVSISRFKFSISACFVLISSCISLDEIKSSMLSHAQMNWYLVSENLHSFSSLAILLHDSIDELHILRNSDCSSSLAQFFASFFSFLYASGLFLESYVSLCFVALSMGSYVSLCFSALFSGLYVLLCLCFLLYLNLFFAMSFKDCIPFSLVLALFPLLSAILAYTKLPGVYRLVSTPLLLTLD